MNIFKEIINLCKDYFQKEKVMAKAYEEITEKMEDGISLADQIVDVLKENKKLKEQIKQAKEIINCLIHLGEFNENTNEEYLNYQIHDVLKQAGRFLKED